MASQTYGVDNSVTARNIGIPATNPFLGYLGGPMSGPGPVNQIAATKPVTTNPLFGRPIWTYVHLVNVPVRGPQPRLARGTGRTGDVALPGNAAQLPGYLSDNEYMPVLDEYAPAWSALFEKKLPRSIKQGSNGRVMVGTYEPHDFTPADRWQPTLRAPANWQEMAYPPNYRNLLAWQQVQRYKIQTATLSARPLASSNYFLGYQIDPSISASIGQSGLGYMGSK